MSGATGRILRAFLSTLSLRRATLGNVVAGLRTSFLSTLSLRRATINGLRHKCASFYFYPRSPCGERLVVTAFPGSADNFYPRSPCGERRIMTIIICIALRFLSTLSLRRATIFPPVDTSSVSISIHALLAESDDRNISLLDIS